MTVPTTGATYEALGGCRRVKWTAPDTVCFQVMVRGRWAKGGITVSLSAWRDWLEGADAHCVRVPPYACPSCGEESDAETPVEQRNHSSSCRHRREVVVVVPRGQVREVVTCPRCTSRWALHPPIVLDKRQRERGAFWMPRHQGPRALCAGFWFDVLDIRQEVCGGG